MVGYFDPSNVKKMIWGFKTNNIIQVYSSLISQTFQAFSEIERPHSSDWMAASLIRLHFSASGNEVLPG